MCCVPLDVPVCSPGSVNSGAVRLGAVRTYRKFDGRVWVVHAVDVASVVPPSRLPPPPSTDALRATVPPSRLPPPPSTDALRATVPPSRLPPPPSTDALRATVPPSPVG